MSRGGRAIGGLGGWLAVALSAGLLVWVLARPVGVNLMSAWTIFVGGAAGLWAALRPSLVSLLGAAVLVALAAFPALPGGVGFLYVPSILLMIAGAGALVLVRK
jgi:hypothetical protein